MFGVQDFYHKMKKPIIAYRNIYQLLHFEIRNALSYLIFLLIVEKIVKMTEIIVNN